MRRLNEPAEDALPALQESVQHAMSMFDDLSAAVDAHSVDGWFDGDAVWLEMMRSHPSECARIIGDAVLFVAGLDGHKIQTEDGPEPPAGDAKEPTS